ncbi:MAG: class I SAM-dependent methyltransferase [Methylovulum sp.]|nr:class I SAM-dependent methyltransferase [Methylovulum sp.]
MELNDYQRQLSEQDIQQDNHRDFVGGLWDEVGEWQSRFMIEHGGLKPEMRLLDLGCGCFRGGIHFIRYLRSGNYYGMDINASLLHAGMEVELPRAGLSHSVDWDHVLVHGQFDASGFGVQFDRILAVSVWTHLPLNHILLCFYQMAKVLMRGGIFFTTIFEVPAIDDFWSTQAQGMGIQSFCYQDPYHYPVKVIEQLINLYNLPFQLTRMGTCEHPRKQVVLALTRI